MLNTLNLHCMLLTVYKYKASKPVLSNRWVAKPFQVGRGSFLNVAVFLFYQSSSRTFAVNGRTIEENPRHLSPSAAVWTTSAICSWLHSTFSTTVLDQDLLELDHALSYSIVGKALSVLWHCRLGRIISLFFLWPSLVGISSVAGCWLSISLPILLTHSFFCLTTSFPRNLLYPQSPLLASSSLSRY